jgi:endonuclease-8
MAEGDTIYRIAAELRPVLVGRSVRAARTRSRSRVDRLVGASISSIETAGKNLLIHFSNGLSLRTHLGMTGTWHHYRPGEAWRRPAARAALVLEVEGAVAVCFDAPVVELLETRALGLHPVLRALGPDLLDPGFDPVTALARLRQAAPVMATIGEALLDQRIMAGIGNVYRSEILFIERVDPFTPIEALGDAQLEGLIGTAQRLLLANVGDQGASDRSATGRPSRGRTTTGFAREAAGSALWVYRRTGRPCRRCGAAIRVASLGRQNPRWVWWCPRCQASQPAARPRGRETGGG